MIMKNMKTFRLLLATVVWSLLSLACSVMPVSAALQHYWALDTDTYNFTAFGNPYSGYEDTGAAASKVPLYSEGVALDSTTQKLGGGAANFKKSLDEWRSKSAKATPKD